MSKQEPHEHKFEEETETVVPLRRVVKEDGKMVRDVMTGRDTLKQRKCECGAVETYDIERKLV